MKDRIRTSLPFQGAPVGGACGFWRRLTRLKIVLGTIVSTSTLFIYGLGLIPLCPLDGANRQEENNEGPNERNPGTCAIQWNSIYPSKARCRWSKWTVFVNEAPVPGPSRSHGEPSSVIPCVISFCTS